AAPDAEPPRGPLRVRGGPLRVRVRWGLYSPGLGTPFRRRQPSRQAGASSGFTPAGGSRCAKVQKTGRGSGGPVQLGRRLQLTVGENVTGPSTLTGGDPPPRGIGVLSGAVIAGLRRNGRTEPERFLTFFKLSARRSVPRIKMGGMFTRHTP